MFFHKVHKIQTTKTTGPLFRPGFSLYCLKPPDNALVSKRLKEFLLIWYNCPVRVSDKWLGFGSQRSRSMSPYVLGTICQLGSSMNSIEIKGQGHYDLMNIKFSSTVYLRNTWKKCHYIWYKYHSKSCKNLLEEGVGPK